MLQALRGFFSRGSDHAQLGFDFVPGPPRNANELLGQLRVLGLKDIDALKLTRNRNVMVSFGKRELRVHHGFLSADESVFRAIATFVNARSRLDRSRAQRVIMSHRIETDRSDPRRERTHPDDLRLAERVREWHERYNREHFDGQLKPVDVRVSRRMKRRLGHYSAAPSAGHRAEIAIGRSHIKRHGWDEALHTLLHEMVHQWQDETGRSIDHGSAFRAKCRELSITPHACRAIESANR